MTQGKSSTGAVCLTLVTCYCLWGLTWIQFLIRLVFGLPLFPYGDCEWALGYYQARAGSFPMNLPDLCVWLSAALVVWAVVTVFMVSRGKDDCWRMRFAVALFSVIVLGYADFVADAEPHHIFRAQSRMWAYRTRMKEVEDWSAGNYGQSWNHDSLRLKSHSLLEVLKASGGVYDRTAGEATELLRSECAAHQKEGMTLLHKHVDFVPEEVGVIPWKEAKWDAEKEAWFFRVFFGETGYLEAWLPNWTTKPSFKVVNPSDLPPWEEALGWKRF